MSVPVLMLADVAAGSAAAWSAGLSWDRAEYVGVLARFLVKATYVTAAACLSVPILGAVVDLLGRYEGDRADMAWFGAHVCAPVAVATLVVAAAAGLWALCSDNWAWPWFHRGAADDASDGGADHVGRVAEASGRVVGGAAQVAFQDDGILAYVFFPDLILLDEELFLVGLGIALAILLVCPGVFVAGAFAAWARSRVRHLASRRP